MEQNKPTQHERSLEEVMRAARLQARAEAPPITTARYLSQLKLRGVFGKPEGE